MHDSPRALQPVPGGTDWGRVAGDVETDEVLADEQLVAVNEGGGVSVDAVVRAAPGQERHLARLARGQTVEKVLRQRPGRVAGERSPEELRLGEEVAHCRRRGRRRLLTPLVHRTEAVEVPLRLSVGHVSAR